MATVLTEEVFLQGMRDAGILEASGSPTVKRREVVGEKAMSGIDPGVLAECYAAYCNWNGSDRGSVDAALEKYRELTGVGPITAEQLRVVDGRIFRTKEQRLGYSDANWEYFADQLNELASRPAPAVVVPEDVRQAVEKIGANAYADSASAKLATFVKSLIPTPPKPEPGQRLFDVLESQDLLFGTWREANGMTKSQCAAAEEKLVAALKGDADGPAN